MRASIQLPPLCYVCYGYSLHLSCFFLARFLILFDESVLNYIFNFVYAPLSESLRGCVFHVLVPTEIIAALAATYAGVIGQEGGKIDERMALPALKESGRQAGHRVAPSSMRARFILAMEAPGVSWFVPSRDLCLISGTVEELT